MYVTMLPSPGAFLGQDPNKVSSGCWGLTDQSWAAKIPGTLIYGILAGPLETNRAISLARSGSVPCPASAYPGCDWALLPFHLSPETREPEDFKSS